MVCNWAGIAYSEMGNVIVKQQFCVANTFCCPNEDKRNLSNKQSNTAACIPSPLCSIQIRHFKGFWFTEHFPFSALRDDRKEGHQACKKLAVRLLMVAFHWSIAGFIAPVVTTTSIILSSNKVQNGDILAPAYHQCPGKRPLNERRRLIWRTTVCISAQDNEFSTSENWA